MFVLQAESPCPAVAVQVLERKDVATVSVRQNYKCFITLSYPTEGHSLASTSYLHLYMSPVCPPVLHQITCVSILQPQPRLTFGHKMILAKYMEKIFYFYCLYYYMKVDMIHSQNL